MDMHLAGRKPSQEGFLQPCMAGPAPPTSSSLLAPLQSSCPGQLPAQLVSLMVTPEQVST